jgi:hypothetical protein
VDIWKIVTTARIIRKQISTNFLFSGEMGQPQRIGISVAVGYITINAPNI